MVERILIVEDEPAIADTIAYALRTEGYEVVWCTTGEDALRLLNGEGISLIVLDVGLPDVNGFDLCREIRKTSGVPILFLTARTDEVDRIVGLELGADDYVPKPFSPREVVARVRAILRRTSTGHGESAASGTDTPFVVDEERMRIAYFGVVLELSRYEFRILQVLIKRPGRVFSRDKLMELVWEAPDASMDRTVDTHVKTIRAKLREAHPGIDPIRTHRGLGYSLRESW